MHMFRTVWIVVALLLLVLLVMKPPLGGQCRDLPTDDPDNDGEGEAQGQWNPYQRSLNELNARTLHLRTEYRQDHRLLSTPPFQAQLRRLEQDWTGLLRRLAQRDGIPARWPEDRDTHQLNLLLHRFRALERYIQHHGHGVRSQATQQVINELERDWTLFVIRQQIRIHQGTLHNMEDRERLRQRHPHYDGR